MNYEDLKKAKKVEVYIPSMNNFYKMEVHDQGDGSFIVSNYGCAKRNKIGGHECSFIIRNQKDVDGFFYMHNESIKAAELGLVTEKAEEHFKKNNRRWIF
jgi:hypothetical protein